ncbi:hypothetical protein [Petropleomorpha daqingensis]|uniref:Uncharacterized protein n=1 Tax=Petropleomorpha daqingensis TaxID=2026353 RepID=A0A853CH13_9ACTN|nr:hypothetical protein [Petropleomorpha daqingensis]NYJ07245.1 hypothetical protein [Petropleomorpha daqingensis]
MTTVVPVARPGALALGRVAAVLVATSAVVHVLQADTASLAGLLMPVMAVACLPCAWHLWRAPTPAVWGMTAALDAGMILVHATLMAGGGMAMHHGAAGPGTLAWAGLVLAGAQLALAALAAVAAVPRAGTR